MCKNNHRDRFRYSVASAAILFALCLILSHPVAARAEISVSAALSSASFTVDESAQLIVTINGTRSADLRIPETDKFEIDQRGRSSQINMVNGRFSSTTTFTCIVRAFAPGRYAIPPITINADGKTLNTEAIPFEVTAASPSAPGSGTAVSAPPGSTVGSEDQAAFLTITGITPQSYIGEIVPVEIKAYFREGMRVNLNSAPTLAGDGSVMPQLHDQPVQSREIQNGVPYNVLTWKTTLSNIKEGKHTIHLELQAARLVPQRRTTTSIFGGQSPFDDDFFDSVFGGGHKQIPMRVTSREVAFEILPLPEKGQPPSFTGAIGDFSLHAAAEPRQAEAGEPLTLTLTVKGTGNFDRIEPPEFTDSSEWKTYTPSSSFTPENNLNVSGKKIFEQAIVARSPAVKEIPALSFSYFDPEKGVYITRSTPPIPVTITGQAEAVSAPPTVPLPAPAPATAPQAALQTETLAGLAPLHLEAGSPVKTIRPPYRKPAFLVLVTICLLALALAVGIKVRQLRSEARPEDRRRQQLSQTLHESLAVVDASLESADSSRFPTACRMAVQNLLGNLWQCEPGAITRSDVARKLPDAPLLLEIFTMAERAAYGGTVLTRQDMDKYAGQLKTELEKLI